jgi:hypothetical protein
MKPFYLSKTFWVNVIALCALLLQGMFGWVLEPQHQAAILALVNLVLRAITREPLSWADGGGASAPLVLLLIGCAGAMSGCAGVQVCREAAIVLRDASEPDRMSLAVECDGTTVVRVDTQEVVTPSGARLRGGGAR